MVTTVEELPVGVVITECVVCGLSAPSVEELLCVGAVPELFPPAEPVVGCVSEDGCVSTDCCVSEDCALPELPCESFVSSAKDAVAVVTDVLPVVAADCSVPVAVTSVPVVTSVTITEESGSLG